MQESGRNEYVSVPRMVELHAREVGGLWFGLAHAGASLAATAVGPTRETTVDSLRRSLPPGIGFRVTDAAASEFVEKTIAQLVELEAGHEGHKEFSLAPDCIVEPFAAILRVAAAIPLGYVTTYGDVGRTAGAEARDVGSAMARNPLYPIVPCHRVVGADFALVGYGGSRGETALRAKLDRLTREVRGFREEREVPVDGRSLRVYPVERVIARAQKRGRGEGRQRSLFE